MPVLKALVIDAMFDMNDEDFDIDGIISNDLGFLDVRSTTDLISNTEQVVSSSSPLLLPSYQSGTVQRSQPQTQRTVTVVTSADVVASSSAAKTRTPKIPSYTSSFLASSVVPAPGEVRPDIAESNSNEYVNQPE